MWQSTTGASRPLASLSLRSASRSLCFRVSRCKLRCGRRAAGSTSSVKWVLFFRLCSPRHMRWGEEVSQSWTFWLLSVCRFDDLSSSTCRWRRQVMSLWLEATWICTARQKCLLKFSLRWVWERKEKKKLPLLSIIPLYFFYYNIFWRPRFFFHS